MPVIKNFGSLVKGKPYRLSDVSPQAEIIHEALYPYSKADCDNNHNSS
jgi:hypothetical protein